MKKFLVFASLLATSSTFAATTTCQAGLSCESSSLISNDGASSAQPLNSTYIPSTALNLPSDSSGNGLGLAGVAVNSCMASSLTGCLDAHSVGGTSPGTSGLKGPAPVTEPDTLPEPLSFVLLGTGLLGIALMSRRLDRR